MTGVPASATGLKLPYFTEVPITHYIADRRAPLLKLAQLLERSTGKATFYRLGAPRDGHNDNPSLGTGAYALDQSWHVGWLFVAALVIA